MSDEDIEDDFILDDDTEDEEDEDASPPAEQADPVEDQLAADPCGSLPPPELPAHPTVWQLHSYLEQLMAVFPETAKFVVCTEGDENWDDDEEEYVYGLTHINQAAFAYATLGDTVPEYDMSRRRKSPRSRPNILLLSRHSD